MGLGGLGFRDEGSRGRVQLVRQGCRLLGFLGAIAPEGLRTLGSSGLSTSTVFIVVPLNNDLVFHLGSSHKARQPTRQLQWRR